MKRGTILMVNFKLILQILKLYSNLLYNNVSYPYYFPTTKTLHIDWQL